MYLLLAHGAWEPRTLLRLPLFASWARRGYHAAATFQSPSVQGRRSLPAL